MNTAAKSLLILALLAGTAFATAHLAPQVEAGAYSEPLQEMIPLRFGDWIAEPEPEAQVVLALHTLGEPEAAQNATYDDVLMRTYRRADGARVMVAFAYGRRQTQEMKIHRPELCYYAQGFEVQRLGQRALRLDGDRRIDTVALLTRNRSRTEVVSYWIRIGERLAHGAWDARWIIFRDGLDGAIPDGLLVRTSSLAGSPAQSEQEFTLQQSFVSDLYGAVPRRTRQFLVGG